MINELKARLKELRSFAANLPTTRQDGTGYNLLAVNGVYDFCDNLELRLELLETRRADLDPVWVQAELEHICGEIETRFEDTADRFNAHLPLSTFQWLARARVFWLNEEDPLHPVKLIYKGKSGWAIEFNEQECLAKNGERYYQPSSSNMTATFIHNTRWTSKEEAYKFWCEWRKQQTD